MTWRIIAFMSLFVSCDQTQNSERLPTSNIPAKDIQSGSFFLTPETRNQQADSFENPGYFWVETGAQLFEESSKNSQSCASCHENSLVSAAATFPKIDAQTGRLFNVEMQVNACRERYQAQSGYEYESEELLALTAFIANQSHGMPIKVSMEGDAQQYFEVGEQEFFKRRGQLNFSCAQCHNENWGKKLRGDTISQGHGNGFPAYRLEWQSMGSLHRRLQDCNEGVRAEAKPLGDPLYVALELYLAVRANGLPLESPAIRR